MADIVDYLRTEVMESEKARMDFLKWKVILIAGLAVVGFGIGDFKGACLTVVLAFIPIVCAYVDLVCIYNDLRIRFIGSFLRRSYGSDECRMSIRAYEDMCRKHRISNVLASSVLLGTTLTMSVMVWFLAYVSETWSLLPASRDGALPFAASVFMGVGAGAGALGSLGALCFQRSRLKLLQREEAEEVCEAKAPTSPLDLAMSAAGPAPVTRYFSQA